MFKCPSSCITISIIVTWAILFFFRYQSYLCSARSAVFFFKSLYLVIITPCSSRYWVAILRARAQGQEKRKGIIVWLFFGNGITCAIFGRLHISWLHPLGLLRSRTLRHLEPLHLLLGLHLQRIRR